MCRLSPRVGDDFLVYTWHVHVVYVTVLYYGCAMIVLPPAVFCRRPPAQGEGRDAPAQRGVASVVSSEARRLACIAGGAYVGFLRTEVCCTGLGTQKTGLSLR